MRTTRAIPEAVIGVLQSVARLTDTDADRAAASGKPAERRSRDRGRRGIARAIGVLETVERIVNAAAEPAAARDVSLPDPPAPALGPKAAGPKTAAPPHDDGDFRGPGDAGAP